jgi:hypothetical protein
MTEFNNSMLSMPHYADLLSVQDTVELEYPVGVTNGVQEATEYGIPNPMRGKTTGHSLPIKPYDRALGWTMMYLRKARMSSIDADVRSAVVDLRTNWQQKLLQRFFKSTGEIVGTTSGASVPFADGGTADSNYVPLPSPDGATFLYTHNHYLRYDTIANAIAPAVKHVQEHGHAGPFDVIAADADAATWAALTTFKSPNWGGIIYRAAEDRAAMSDIGNYFGYVETDHGIARIWLNPRVPTNYFGVFKAYGAGDPRSPLRVRIDPNTGFGWSLVPGNWVNAPTTLAVMYSEYGVGIGEDRTNGVAVYLNASGSYTDPTIS